MEATELKANLKTQIIQYLNLLDIIPEEIKDETPLFDEKLGLEFIERTTLKSITILEKRKFLVDANQMAEYIIEYSDEIP